MPFIGVRISWLIIARNSDFAREACSADSLARFVSRSFVISLKATTTPSIWPNSIIGETR
ncbi:hypothetical protein D3C72_2027720 [compost metagenome]